MRSIGPLLATVSLPSAMAVCLGTGQTALTQFRGTVSMVPVHVTVHTADGRLLTNLKAADFEVHDEGVRRQIVLFSDQVAPLTILNLIDVSPSMAKQLQPMRQFAESLANALGQGDSIRLGTFGGEVAISPLRTSDRAVLRRILDEELWIGSGSPVWSSLERGLRVLAREEGRRALIVLTDGDSAGPDRSREEIFKTVHESDTMVYAVGFESTGLSEALKQLAASTGGGWTVIEPRIDLAARADQTLRQLRHSYLIGFEAAVEDGRLHRLDVKVAVPGAAVRSRSHYVATQRR